MKIIVNPHKLEIAKEPVNEREIDITKCEFEFADEITNDYVKEAYFTFKGNTYKQIIVNNECDIPSEVLTEKGQVEIGVVAFKTEGTEEIKRYNPSPAYFNTWVGSLKDDAENSEPITPTDKEQIESAIASIQAEQITQNESISQNTSNITSLSEGKQDKLISGQNIKTINNESLLGAGNLEVITDLSDYYTKGQTDDLLDDKADRSEIPDVSEFIKKDVDNLTNYTKTNDMNTAINTAVGNERASRESSDVALQNQIDAITASSDVVDVVSTYQDLLNYSTTSLTEDDIIKVMQDESHSNAISYFRWQLSTWNYIGSEGPFYTKGETDTLLNNKANVSDLPDLTNYVKNTDYATNTKGGVVKVNSYYGADVYNGILLGSVKNYNTYENQPNSTLISKGTLENVITGKHLVNQSTLEDSQAAQDENIDELKAELDRYKLLENALPHTENETESDYVTLQNTAKSPMEVSLIPQTSQETTTGKNLFNPNRPVGSQTQNGVTVINNGDGTYTVSGTSTRSLAIPLTTSNTIVLKNNKPYTNQIEILNGTFVGNLVATIKNEDETTSYNYFKLDSNTLSQTKTPNDNKIISAYEYYISEANISPNFTFRVQLELGSEATSYEKFTGGIPAPNPDYPEDIHRTTGENQVKVVGKNLFDLEILLDTTNYTSYSQYFSYYELPSNYKTTFTVSMILKGTSQNLVFGFTDQTLNFYGDYRVLNGGTISSPKTYDFSEATKVYFFVGNANNLNLSRDSQLLYNNYNIQLEEGSTATPYTPYEETTYPISLGTKEMFNINGLYDGFVYDETTDKFYINRKIGKTSIIGSDVRLVDSYANAEYGAVAKPNDFSGRGIYDQIKVLCNKAHYAATSNWNNSDNVGIISGNANQNHWWIGFAKETGLTNIQNSLDGSVIVYPLLTETPEEITDTTLISQLRAIKNALSMQGTTHIISTSSGTNLPFLIKARAVQNISNS